ncbi:MAG: hypothetical protein K8M05_23615 [Deltaproteobacteria bacterium]|nr:hypothetical protein [Kofleriaceae bacterium]
MRRHALTTLHVTLVGLGCLAACGGDDGGSAADAGVDAIVGGAQAPFPRLACPGDPGCESTGDGTLRAAAARVDITPELAGKDRGWQDEDGDHVYDEAEPFEDVDGDGVFDAVWIAGSQNARPATGVHDPLWARVMVLDQGDVRVAVVVYDLIGWFIDDMERTRALLGPELGLDHVIFASTHSHQSPDTMGLWGPTSLASGVDPAYMERVRTRTALALREAVAALEPVHVRVATTPTLDGTGLARPYLADLRDPVVLDPTLTIVHLTSAAEPGRTIGSLVHWSSHPEYVGFDNNLLSSDIVHYIRATIEDGAPATPPSPGAAASRCTCRACSAGRSARGARGRSRPTAARSPTPASPRRRPRAPTSGGSRSRRSAGPATSTTCPIRASRSAPATCSCASRTSSITWARSPACSTATSSASIPSARSTTTTCRTCDRA